MIPLSTQYRRRCFSQIYLIRPYYLPSSYYWGWEAHVRTPYSIDAACNYALPGWVLVYTLAGQGKLSRDQHSYTVRPGSAFFLQVPCEATFKIAEEVGEWEFLMFLVNTTCDSYNLGVSLAEKLWRRENPLLQLGDEHPLVAQMCRFIERSSARPEGFTDAQELALESYAMLLGISRLVDTVHDFPQGIIYDALTFMKTRLAEHITLASLAEELHVSPSSISHLFCLHVGIPPMQYLLRLRLEQAVIMLVQTRLVATDIARHCGFQSYVTLTQAMRRLLGLSPSRLRAQQRLPACRELWGTKIPHALLLTSLADDGAVFAQAGSNDEGSAE